MKICIYNTLSRQIEEFVPIDPSRITIYSCGPTVYSRQHLWNLRAAFLVDVYKNIVQYIWWYPVMHVMNITDVGHLTGDNEGDADHGEDKMEKGAKKEWLTAREVSKKYTDLYLQDISALRVDPFDVMPRATDHIAEQIAMVAELEAKWLTYIIPGDGVYMDTSTVQDYGKLIGKKHMEGLEQWARIDDAGKRNPTDFALWKFNVTGKKRDMEWDSPRGVGFPGRHIECSAMSMKYLGTHIDIHTGGMEHIPVHHTNEICQSECSHGHIPRVNYRLHNQWLMMNGKKISKSDGNVAYMDDVLDRGFVWEDLRYFFLQAHYRSFQDFSRSGLEAAKKWRLTLKKKCQEKGEIGDAQRENICSLLAHDFDTPKMLAEIHTVWAWKELDEKILKLGLYDEEPLVDIVVPAAITALAEERVQAKQVRDFFRADELRKQILDAWWSIQDTSEGYQLERADG